MQNLENVRVTVEFADTKPAKVESEYYNQVEYSPGSESSFRLRLHPVQIFDEN